MRVLIGGAKYGCKNVGDEAALAGIVSDVRVVVPDARITVITDAGERTRAWLNVTTVPLKNPLRVPAAMLNADRFICGGGTILSDTPRYALGLVRLAHACRTPTMIYGVGMEEIPDPWTRAFVRGALQRVPLITVRDEDSRSRVKRYGARGKVIATADPAVTLSPCPQERAQEIIRSAGLDPKGPSIVAIGIAAEKHLLADTPVAQFVKASQALADEHNFAALYVPMCARKDADVMLIDRIVRDADRSGQVGGLREEYFPAEVIGVVRECAMVAGSRLHLMIFGAIVGKPSVGVSRGPKIDTFLAQGGEKAVSTIPDMTSECLVEKILATRRNYAERVVRVREATAAMLRGCQENRLTLGAWLRGDATP